LDIRLEAKVCHIGYSIGFMSKDHIISWADRVIHIMEVPVIPDRVFDLSMVKDTRDIPRILEELGANAKEDVALKVIVGLIHAHYRGNDFTLYEACELLYRVGTYVDLDHVWHRFLYEITGNVELAVDGYGEITSAKQEMETFLAGHEEYTALFSHGFVPSLPESFELKPKKELVSIDVSRIGVSKDIHIMLSRELDFPDFYGSNWNAFWDAITGLVKMPRKLRLSGWRVFRERFPEEAVRLRGLLEEYKRSYSQTTFEVEYV